MEQFKYVPKKVIDQIEELRSWLPSYNHGEKELPTLVMRLLASMPGGDRAEDMGYEPFNLSWKEVELLGNMLTAIENTKDVEVLVAALSEDNVIVTGKTVEIYSDEEEVPARKEKNRV